MKNIKKFSVQSFPAEDNDDESKAFIKFDCNFNFSNSSKRLRASKVHLI